MKYEMGIDKYPDVGSLILFNVFGERQYIRSPTGGDILALTKELITLLPVHDCDHENAVIEDGKVYNLIMSGDKTLHVFTDDLNGNLEEVENPIFVKVVCLRAKDVLESYLGTRLDVIGFSDTVHSAAAAMKQKIAESVAIPVEKDDTQIPLMEMFKPKGTNIPGNSKSMHNKVKPGKFFNKNKTFRSSGRGR